MLRCFAEDYAAENVKLSQGRVRWFKIETALHVDSMHSFMLFMVAACLLLPNNTPQIFHQPLIIVF